MPRKTEADRASKPLPTEIPTDPDEIARREARNALRQFDAVVEIIDEALGSDRPFKLRPSTVLELNRLAIEGVNQFAGVYRPHSIAIVGSRYDPPPAKDVPVLVEEMCEYVNESWRLTPIHLAAYLMWRVNWVHPFSDGNGRTARALSYAVLCVRLGYRLPGTMTIPEQITKDKSPYYGALEAADEVWAQGRVDVGALEKLLSDKLAAQLLKVHEEASSGKS